MADSACEPSSLYAAPLARQLQVSWHAPCRLPPRLTARVQCNSPMESGSLLTRSRHRNATATKHKNAIPWQRIQANEALLAGMLNSDGVVVFGTNGTVSRYRIFLKPRRAGERGASHKGGGRRRTFELMREGWARSSRLRFAVRRTRDRMCELGS